MPTEGHKPPRQLLNVEAFERHVALSQPLGAFLDLRMALGSNIEKPDFVDQRLPRGRFEVTPHRIAGAEDARPERVRVSLPHDAAAPVARTFGVVHRARFVEVDLVSAGGQPPGDAPPGDTGPDNCNLHGSSGGHSARAAAPCKPASAPKGDRQTPASMSGFCDQNVPNQSANPTPPHKTMSSGA